MKRRFLTSVLPGLLAMTFSCSRNQGDVDSKSIRRASDYVASPRREIIAPNVLAVQLAAHNEIETGAVLGSADPISASLSLTASVHIEPRAIPAYLVRDEAVCEEQCIGVAAGETRYEFDFRFVKTPRPQGSWQIRFVEFARSNGKPVLLARLFLKVD